LFCWIEYVIGLVLYKCFESHIVGEKTRTFKQLSWTNFNTSNIKALKYVEYQDMWQVDNLTFGWVVSFNIYRKHGLIHLNICSVDSNIKHSYIIVVHSGGMVQN